MVFADLHQKFTKQIGYDRIEIENCEILLLSRIEQEVGFIKMAFMRIIYWKSAAFSKSVLVLVPTVTTRTNLLFILLVVFHK